MYKNIQVLLQFHISSLESTPVVSAYLCNFICTYKYSSAGYKCILWFYWKLEFQFWYFYWLESWKFFKARRKGTFLRKPIFISQWNWVREIYQSLNHVHTLLHFYNDTKQDNKSACIFISLNITQSKIPFLTIPVYVCINIHSLTSMDLLSKHTRRARCRW